MSFTKSLRSVRAAVIRRRSGFDVVSHPSIQYLREGSFCKVEAAVTGEAPKDFLRVYDYGRGRKANPHTWPAYIAKVGQKYYPNESITEQLMTRIGQLMGLEMAESRLMWVRGQLRFLSEYFLKEDESLVHGAQIFAGYLENDGEFVRKVEELKMSQEIFTFQVVEAAIRTQFPLANEQIMKNFARLIGFDAVVGNNDRHFFNWGIVTQVSGNRLPRFSPIYDTARALFWNRDEAALEKFDHKGQFHSFIDRYSTDCYPKTGWDGLSSPNHFTLIQKVAQERPMYREVLKPLNQSDLPQKVEALLHDEFDGMFSKRRKRFILCCLQMRLKYFSNAIGI